MISVSRKKAIIIGIIVSLVSSIITSFNIAKPMYEEMLEKGGSISYGGVFFCYMIILFVVFEIVNLVYILALNWNISKKR